MKRHKKLVSLLIALCFVFSLVPMAAASTAPAPHPADGATARLNALGIVEGYPDGTFGLTRDITRAEFAKIAVMTGGFGAGADLLRATPSRFSDVRTDVWYTGWINMASARGLMRGDPAGTFRPNDRINNAEVVTVLMRLLGYDDRLPGDWPIDYLVEAASLEVTKGLTIDARAAAIRGNVFIMTGRVLDADVVIWNKDAEKFEKRMFGAAPGAARTLIAQNFDAAMTKDVIVTSWRYDRNKDEFEIKTITPVAAPAESAWISVKKDATLVRAANVPALMNNVVNYLTNKDGEIVWAEVQNYGRTVTSAQSVRIDNNDFIADVDHAGRTVRITDRSFRLNTNAIMRTAAAGAGVATFAPITANLRFDVEAGAGVTQTQEVGVLLDKDGRAVYLWAENPSMPGIFKSYSAATKTMELKDNGAQDLAAANTEFAGDNKVFRVVRDGRVVTLADLRPDDQIHLTTVAYARRGYDVVVTARSATATGATATGVLNSVSPDRTKITVGGRTFDFAGRPGNVADVPTVSTDNGETFARINAIGDLTNLFDKQVVVGLDRLGKVVYVRGVGVTADLYAVVNRVFSQIVGGATEVTSVELVLPNGTKVAYAPNKPSEWAAITAGTLVKYGLEANGRLSAPGVPPITQTTQITGYNDDLRRATVGGRDLFITAQTVIWDRRGGSANDEIVLVTPADFREGLKGFNPTAANPIVVAVHAAADANHIQFIVVNGVVIPPAVVPQDVAFGVSGIGTFAVVTGKAFDGKHRLSLNVKGTVASYEYTAADRATYNAAATGDLVQVDIVGGVINNPLAILAVRTTAAAHTVDRVDAATSSFRVTNGGGTWVVVDKDTVIYDVRGTVPAVAAFGALANGSRIDYAANAAGVATWIVIK